MSVCASCRSIVAEAGRFCPNCGGALPAGGPTLDALDDRLFAAAVHRNKITGALSLWSAHNIEVDATGVGNAAGNRNGSRWYEISNLTGAPVLTQSGTLLPGPATMAGSDAASAGVRPSANTDGSTKRTRTRNKDMRGSV